MWISRAHSADFIIVMALTDKEKRARGGMGMSKELPLEFIYRRLRPMRIFEGPTQVHRWVIARSFLRE